MQWVANSNVAPTPPFGGAAVWPAFWTGLWSALLTAEGYEGEVYTVRRKALAIGSIFHAAQQALQMLAADAQHARGGGFVAIGLLQRFCDHGIAHTSWSALTRPCWLS